jgi:hypothetical protein
MQKPVVCGKSAFFPICSLAFLLLFSSNVAQGQPFLTGQIFTDAAYGNGTYVVIEASDWIWTSPDLVMWARRPQTATHLSGVAFGNGEFVAVGEDTAMRGVILHSADGLVWSGAESVEPSGLPSLRRVAFQDGHFMAVGGYVNVNGSAGWIYSSPDGKSWQRPYFAAPWPNGPGPGLFAVAFGQDTYLAVGGGQRFAPPYGGYTTVVESPDAQTWVKTSNQAGGVFSDVAFGNESFVALGGATVQTRTNGVWASGPDATALLGIGFGRGRFVAVGYGGLVQTSEDGLSWTNRASTTTSTLRRVVFVNDRFLALGDSRTILGSSDGIEWSTVLLSAAPSAIAGKLLPNGSFDFSVCPGTCTSITVQASADLGKWTTITNVSGASDPSSIQDGEASGLPYRFYRAIGTLK